LPASFHLYHLRAFSGSPPPSRLFLQTPLVSFGLPA
jgi:hypothetical protein